MFTLPPVELVLHCPAFLPIETVQELIVAHPLA